MKIFNTIILTLIFVIGFSVQGHAQSATVQAEGTVLEPLTVTGTNLGFGAEIFPGINEVVERTNGSAAQFDIAGENGKEITATFTLPENLEDGANTLPITFSATDAGHATVSTEQETATGFDPSAGVTTALSAEGALFIWLGGTVEPAENQASGTYSADITLDTVYTGE